MPINRVKEKLAKNETALSMIVRLVRGVEIAGIAKTAGLDSIFVDLQHGGFSLETTSQICMACLGAGVAPFVRLPGPDPALAARVLDGGALGIVVPSVDDAETARAMVRASKYPPRGERSYASSLPHFDFAPIQAKEAMARLDAATAVVAMIETRAGLANAAAIAAVDGIDILHVGTNDLANDLGVGGELDHPRMREAYRELWTACRAHGKHLGVGGLASKPDFAAELRAMGARYFTSGSDLGFLLGKASEQVRVFRGEKSR